MSHAAAGLTKLPRTLNHRPCCCFHPIRLLCCTVPLCQTLQVEQFSRKSALGAKLELKAVKLHLLPGGHQCVFSVYECAAPVFRGKVCGFMCLIVEFQHQVRVCCDVERRSSTVSQQ